jgi:lipoprotein-anchoring transpeptidase ErfK/SrfK
MHRAALRALAACASLTAFSTTLPARPLTLDAHRYAQAPVAVPMPPPAMPEPVQVQQANSPANFGGGFIEFLFRGSIQPQPGSQYQVQPQYAPQQPQQPPQTEPVTYGPDPEDPGYRDPILRSPRHSVPSAVPQSTPRVDPARYQINPRFLKQTVSYKGTEPAGTIIIDTPNKHLYLIQGDGTALRYGVGVGRPGFTWAGTKQVSLKKEWPDWVPPPEMLERQPELPRHMAGGPKNPLGARALYLGSSLYRIHGSNEPWTIGTNVSSGCIRMRNEDVIDLYERVKVGTKVVVI